MQLRHQTISKNEVTILEQIDREKVKSQIYEVRGLRVMLDSDIAAYFGVATGNLNKAKNRNIERFPENFCFTLSDHEISLFQFGIPMQRKGIKGGRSKDYFFNSVEMQYACSMCIVQIGEMISLLEPCINRSKTVNRSYPSGHTAYAYVYALFMAEIMPQKRSEFLKRAEEIGKSRIFGGVHYPSDVAAGRILAEALFTQFMQSKLFREKMKELH